jgi:hypothetical protein
MTSFDDHARAIEGLFEAVSFKTGSTPTYERLRDLVMPSGLLIKNTGEAPEVTTVDGFIEPRRALVDSGELNRVQRVRDARQYGALRPGRPAAEHLRQARRQRRRGVRGRRRHLDAVRPHAGGLAHQLDGLGRRAPAARRWLQLRRRALRGLRAARLCELLPLPPLPAPIGSCPITERPPRAMQLPDRGRRGPAAHVKPEDGGEKRFCGDCGSAPFGTNPSHADPIGIRMGTFDQDPAVRPTARQFVSSAAPWAPIPKDGLRRHEQSRHASQP